MNQKDKRAWNESERIFTNTQTWSADKDGVASVSCEEFLSLRLYHSIPKKHISLIKMKEN